MISPASPIRRSFHAVATGATGFLGSTLAQELIEQRHQVIAEGFAWLPLKIGIVMTLASESLELKPYAIAIAHAQ